MYTPDSWQSEPCAHQASAKLKQAESIASPGERDALVRDAVAQVCLMRGGTIVLFSSYFPFRGSQSFSPPVLTTPPPGPPLLLS